MNANAAVLQTMALETWREPRYSTLPTLLTTAVSTLLLFAVWFSVSDGWPVLSADFLPPPDGDLPPVEAPAPFDREERQPRWQSSDVTYFVVASEEASAAVRQMLAFAAMEQANGTSRDFSTVLVRVATTAEEEALLQHELSAAETWSGQPHSVRLLDLR
jgi:hypothetical protein